MNKLPLLLLTVMYSACWQGQTEGRSQPHKTFRLFHYPNIQPEYHLLVCETLNWADEDHVALSSTHFAEDKIPSGSKTNKIKRYDNNKVRKYESCARTLIQI